MIIHDLNYYSENIKDRLKIGFSFAAKFGVKAEYTEVLYGIVIECNIIKQCHKIKLLEYCELDM